MSELNSNQQYEISLLNYIQNYLYIKYKKESDGGEKVGLFKLNKPQMKLYNLVKKMIEEKKPIRVIILKARQMGFSTLVEAIIFAMTTLNKNIKAGIVAHEEKATTNLLNMFKFYYNHLPKELQPETKATNTKEVIYDTADGKGLGSSITCMTATPDGIGRSATFDFLHLSEYAFWKCDKNGTYSDLMQAVPDSPKSMVFIESTANGFDDFKKKWDKAVLGESDYEPLFVAWHEMEEYRRPYYGFELTKEEQELMLLYKLDLDQITWRRWCIANNCGGDLNKFNQEYPACPEDAFIASGNCMFNLQSINARLKELGEPIKRGYFQYDYVYDSIIKDMTIKNPRWVDDPKGEVFIYEEVKEYHPYVTGGDTAGEGSDANVLQVLNNTNGKQACKYKTVKDSDIFAKQCFAIGLYYNEALMNIETNYNAGVVGNMQRWNYPRFYRREVYDQIAKQNREAYGFRTTTVTRPVILDRLIPIVRDRADLIMDYETLTEMQTFCLNATGKKYEAQDGKHDDHVMALAIAYESYASMQMSHSLIYGNKELRKKNWIEESLEKQNKERRKSKWW